MLNRLNCRQVIQIYYEQEAFNTIFFKFIFKLGLSQQTNLGNSLRYAYLYEGLVSICKSNQPLQSQQPTTTSSSLNLKSLLLNHNNSKFKQSRRHVFLFDGLLIFTKKLPVVSAISTLSNITSPAAATLMNSPNNMRSAYRFKQALSLDKCHLRDRDDDFCFELHVCNSVSFHNFNQQQQMMQQMSNQSSQDRASPSQLSPNTFQSNCNQVNSNQECILFMTNTLNEKYQWMSMLCYSQYKFTIDRLLQTMTEEHNRNNPLPIPPRGYIFDQPDTPETILFDNQQSKEDAAASSATANNSGSTSSVYSARSMMLMATDSLSIKAATMIKLVERLTHHLYLHPKFSSTFLMFFRGFATPKELLSLLSQRYDVPDLNINELDNKYNFNRFFFIIN
jgi:hypothetical protein